MKTIPQILSAELNQPEAYIQNVIALLDEGNTIPFIARYRKEAARRDGRHDAPHTAQTRLQYLQKSTSPAPMRRSSRSIESQEQADGRARRRDRRGRSDARRRSKTSTGPTSKSAAPARPSPARSGLEPLAEADAARRRAVMAAPRTLARTGLSLTRKSGVETVADALAGRERHSSRRQFSDDADDPEIAARADAEAQSAACSHRRLKPGCGYLRLSASIMSFRQPGAQAAGPSDPRR